MEQVHGTCIGTTTVLSFEVSRQKLNLSKVGDDCRTDRDFLRGGDAWLDIEHA